MKVEATCLKKCNLANIKESLWCSISISYDLFSFDLLLAGRVHQWIMTFPAPSQTSIALSATCSFLIHLKCKKLTLKLLKPYSSLESIIFLCIVLIDREIYMVNKHQKKFFIRCKQTVITI